MSIRAICNRNVICATKDMTILEAARLMKENHVGDVVVVDQLGGPRRPIGMLTDRDIVTRVVSERLAPATLTVEDVMTRHIQTATLTDGIFATIRGFQEGGIRRQPVTDDDGVLQGIVAVDDLLQLLASELAHLASVSVREVGHERAGWRRDDLPHASP